MDLRNKQTGFHPTNSIEDSGNPWINYFDQPEINYIYQGKNNNIIDTEAEANDDSILLYDLSKQDIRNYHNIIKNTLRIKKSITDFVDNYIKQHFRKNTVGIHIRGTDSFFDKGRPSFPLKYYINLIKLKLTDYDKIFISTDTVGVIEKLKELFGDRIITYSTLKTDINYHYLALHENNNNPYLIGLEVLVDSLLLSKCNLLVRQQSNITTFSVLYNPDLKVHQFDLPLWSQENYHLNTTGNPQSQSVLNTKENFYQEHLQLENINDYKLQLENLNNKLETVDGDTKLYKYTDNNKNIMKEYFYKEVDL